MPVTARPDDKQHAAHASAIHAIAQRSGRSEEEVRKLYELELARLRTKARVNDFLPVLLQRRVEEELRAASN